MAIYEFTNPSDPYTFEAPDLAIAAVVTFLMGGGQAGATPVGGGDDVPIFLFGGSEAWVQSKFGRDLKPWFDITMATRKSEIIAALESFLHGEDRDRSFWGVASREDRAAYNEKRRTSTNAIGKRAFALADQLRMKEAA